MREAVDVWSENLPEELKFWEQALSADDEPGPTLRGRAANRELPQWVRNEIREPGDPVRILDVGSGPLTTLGPIWPGREVELIALDPLADQYNELLNRLGIDAPVPPIPGSGERLLDQFGREEFDFVLSVNALDHCAQPAAVIQGMVAVAKVGATVFLNHIHNVADHEQHIGLHQWNLRPEAENDMLIEGYGGEVLLSDVVPGQQIEIIDRQDDFVTKIRKLMAT